MCLRRALLCVSAAALAAAGAAGSGIPRPAYCGVDPSGPGPAVNVAPVLARADVGLAQAVVVIRHGDRSPEDESFWPALESSGFALNCTLRHDSVPSSEGLAAGHLFRKVYVEAGSPMGNCGWGQLTAVGHDQQRLHGQMLRNSYVDAWKLVDAAAPDPAFVRVRSDDYPRTQLSAQSLVGGMWPGFAGVLDISTAPMAHNVMHPNPLYCPALKDVDDRARASPGYLAILDRAAPVLANLSAVLGLGGENLTIYDGGSLLDVAHVLLCHGHGDQLPAGFASIFEALQEVELRRKTYTYTYPNASYAVPYNVGGLFGLMYDTIAPAAAAAPDAARFALFSGHDTTIEPVMAGLTGADPEWAPYASLVAIETYRNETATLTRVLYNGETQKLPACPGDADGLMLTDCVVGVIRGLRSSPEMCGVTATRRRWRG